MSNSQKIQTNDLLPQRRSNLGRFILLAVVIHVVAAAFYFQFKTQKPEELPGIKVKPDKTVSKPVAKELMITSEATGAKRSMTAQRGPMHSEIHIVKLDLKRAVIPVEIHMAEPKTPIVDTPPGLMRSSPKATTVAQPRNAKLQRAEPMGVRQMAAGIWPADVPRLPKVVYVVPPSSALTTPATQLLGVDPAKPEFGTASLTALNTMAADLSMLLALIHKTSADPMSDMVYPANSGRPLVAGNALQQVLQTEALGKQALDRPAAAGTLMHKTHVGLKTVFTIGEGYMHSAPTPPTLFNEIRMIPKLPPAPDPLADNIAGLLDRLTQSVTGSVKGEHIRILVKNITYRDKNLESEGSKYLSSLIRSDISKRGRVNLLSPGDISQTPHFELEGEVWDEPQKISLRLRIEEGNTNRKLDSAAVDIAAQVLPTGLAVKPPKGKSLDIVERVVAMMQQIFPPPGDFQISVSPDKGLDAVYLEGESFLASILTDKNAHLRVDFYQVDGRVIHILPNGQQSDVIKRGFPFLIGDPEGPYQFIVAEPFGQELLVVIASRKPIPMKTGSIIEPAKPYIRQLSDVLNAHKAVGEMAAAHYIIVTKARKR